MNKEISAESILTLGVNDYIGLWNIIFRVNNGPYTKSEKLPDWVQEKTLQLIKELLERKLMDAGFPSDKPEEAFQVIESEPRRITDWIKQEWDKINHTPNIGDIIWFNLTPEGERIAEELNQRKVK